MNDQLKSSVRANRLLSGCKGLARPAQDRMIRTEETERRQPKPMGKRLKARALAALALALIGLGANAAPVVGTLNTIGLTGLNTAITWTPTNDPIYTDQGFIAGPAVTLYTTNPSAGSFSNVFAPGPYVVSFPLISWRRAFEVIVPPGTNLVQFTNTFLFPRYFVDAAALQSQINLMLQNGYATNGSGGGVTNNQVLPGIPLTTNGIFAGAFSGSGNSLQIDTAARTSHRYPQLLYRGIDSFYANVTGGPTNHMAREFWCLQQATNFITSGLASYGWNAIRIGPGWWWGRDPVTGSIQYNTNFFPDGMQVTISNLHALGMKVVLYYDNGQINNSGSLYPTNYPFNSDYSVSSVQASNDCVTFKNWKIDALAWDDGGIGGTSDAITRANIEQWSWWLKSIAPEISFISFGSGITNYDWVVTTPSNIGNAWHGVTYANAHKLPNWRVNASDQTAFFMDNWAGQSQGATFCEEIAWADNAAQYKSLEMGSIWNEGQYPWDPAAAGGTNYALGKIAVTFWSLFHSPYLLSGNGAFAYSFDLPFLTNSTLLNLQTDPAQNRPVKVFDNGIGGAAWAETLNNGSVALAFLNYSNGVQQIVTLPLSSLGLGTNVSYTAYDAWGKTNFTVSNTYTWNCTNYYYNADLLILSVPAASSGLTAAQTAAQIASSNLVTAAMMATQIASSNHLAAPGGVGSFNGGSLTNVSSQPLNPYQFGAQGNNTTDDGLAFSNMVWTAQNSTNRIIDLMGGKYFVKSAMPLVITNAGLEIYSSGNAVLRCTNNGPVFKILANRTYFHNFILAGNGTNYNQTQAVLTNFLGIPYGNAVTLSQNLDVTNYANFSIGVMFGRQITGPSVGDYAQAARMFMVAITNFDVGILNNCTVGAQISGCHVTSCGSFSELDVRADETELQENIFGFSGPANPNEWGVGTAFSQTNCIGYGRFGGIGANCHDNDIGQSGRAMYVNSSSLIWNRNDLESFFVPSINAVVCELTNVTALQWANNGIGWITGLGASNILKAAIGLYGCVIDRCQFLGPIAYQTGSSNIPALAIYPNSTPTLPYADGSSSFEFDVYTNFSDTVPYRFFTPLNQTMPNSGMLNHWTWPQQLQNNTTYFGSDSGLPTLSASTTKNWVGYTWDYTTPSTTIPWIHIINYGVNAGFMELGGDPNEGKVGEQTIYFCVGSTTAASSARAWAIDGTSSNGDLLPQTLVNIANSSRGVATIWATNFVALGGGSFTGNGVALTSLVCTNKIYPMSVINTNASTPCYVAIPMNNGVYFTNFNSTLVTITNLLGPVAGQMTSVELVIVNGNGGTMIVSNLFNGARLDGLATGTCNTNGLSVATGKAAHLFYKCYGTQRTNYYNWVEQ